MTVTRPQLEQSGPAASDAERRAALARADRLRAAGREVRVSTVWVRAAWWLVLACCAAVGVGASVVAVAHPVVGTAIAGGALLVALLDLTPRAPVRQLTFARATENVVALPAARPDERPVVLVLTTAGDLPRAGLARHLPGGVWRWSIGGLALVTACCGARIAGAQGTWIGVLQLLPTLVLLAALLALLDEAIADTDKDTDDTAVAAVLDAAHLLAADPPRHLDVAVVLAGAGDRRAAGLAAWLRERRRRGLRPAGAAIVHVESQRGAAPGPIWWERGGLLVGGRLHPQLVTAARAAAADVPGVGAHPAAGRTTGAAAEARNARWPAIAVGPGSDGGEPLVTFLVALARRLDGLVEP
ncbi:unannotated protein [freshwater metagenome]|uniref:Unannotated protein n=1 Tax=freshwater metagenome TaxID=449393 RepID=A0A6J7HF41_9ZZZZ|nr:hypothetical protein [Actinomycetota bacterium]